MDISIPFFRSRFPLAVAISYLIPLLFWSFFVLRYVPETVGFWSLGLGWLLMAVGTLLVYCTGVEKSTAPAIEDVEHLQKIDALTKELESIKNRKTEITGNEEKELSNLENTISEQKERIEKQAKVIDHFEMRFSSLSKELLEMIKAHKEGKTGKVTGEHLFNFLQKTNKSAVDVEEEGEAILKRCLKIAEQHTSAWSFSPQMSRGSNTLDSHALDQRRFYQALSQEKKGVVFVYSVDDGKVHFVNQAAKELLGWNPELFAQDFHELIGSGEQKWKEAIGALKEMGDTAIKLPIKQRNREEIVGHCQIGQISKGLFQGQVLGVLLV